MRYVVFHIHDRLILGFTSDYENARMLASNAHNHTYARMTLWKRIRWWYLYR